MYLFSEVRIKKLYKEAFEEAVDHVLRYGDKGEKKREEIIDKNVKEWIRIHLEGR